MPTLTADISVNPAAAAGQGGPAGGRLRPRGGYTVQKGDTLSKISKQFYGDANKYKKIFDANKDQLKDPDKIQPGQVTPDPDLGRGRRGAATTCRRWPSRS